MKGFYILLAAVALAGAILIWLARGSSGANAISTVDPLPVSGEAFPGYSTGSDSAPVVVTEFADFECPACAQFAVLTEPDIRSRLVATGQVRYVFKDFPLAQHVNALAAHLAAACAADQGTFWEMHDLIFFRHSTWVAERRPERRLRDLAGELGIDLGQYDECVDSRRHADRIARTHQEGEALGVTSTPSFIIGDRLIKGVMYYDEFKELVEQVASAVR